MKKLLLIALLIVGCVTDPEDCAGVAEGSAYVDHCGVCDDIPENDCVPDCAGVWGGDSVDDCNGYCGGDSFNGGCDGACYAGGATVLENDCNNECGGNAIDFGCGICIDYDEVDFKDTESQLESTLSATCQYKNSFSNTYSTNSPNPEASYIFHETDNNDAKVLISAPHSQRTFRYSESDNTHVRDLYTGAYAQILHEITDMPTIIARYKSDDPNYYDHIPSETMLYPESIGELIPYKEKMKEYLEYTNQNIMMVIDLHGAANDDFERTWAIDIGTGSGESLNSEIGECVPNVVTHIFDQYNIEVTYNQIYAAWTAETVTRFIAQDINRDLDAMQFEMKRDYRNACNYNDESFAILMAYVELINTMNYIYSTNITSQ